MHEPVNPPASAPPKPEPPPVTQAELQACITVHNAVEEIAGGFGRRLLAGAQVEPGPISVDWDGEPQAEASNIIGLNAGGLIIGPDDPPQARGESPEPAA